MNTEQWYYLLVDYVLPHVHGYATIMHCAAVNKVWQRAVRHVYSIKPGRMYIAQCLSTSSSSSDDDDDDDSSSTETRVLAECWYTGYLIAMRAFEVAKKCNLFTCIDPQVVQGYAQSSVFSPSYAVPMRLGSMQRSKMPCGLVEATCGRGFVKSYIRDIDEWSVGDAIWTIEIEFDRCHWNTVDVCYEDVRGLFNEFAVGSTYMLENGARKNYGSGIVNVYVNSYKEITLARRGPEVVVAIVVRFSLRVSVGADETVGKIIGIRSVAEIVGVSV